jgi:hypothetical protein
MSPNAQIFLHLSTTLWTFLRSPSSINFSKELSSLPANVLDKLAKLTKSGIKHVLTQETLGTDSIVQIFHEDHVTSVTKSVGLLKVEVRPCVVNRVVESCHLDALFLVVFRRLELPTQSALQHFQPTLQILEELRRQYARTITGCQKLGQPNINADRMTVRHWVGNTDITLDVDRCVPSVSFPDDSYLLDHKPTRY